MPRKVKAAIEKYKNKVTGKMPKKPAKKPTKGMIWAKEEIRKRQYKETPFNIGGRAKQLKNISNEQARLLDEIDKS